MAIGNLDHLGARFFKIEFRCMDTDNLQPLITVFFLDTMDPWFAAQAIDSNGGPDLDQ